jgi:hypothetical protein
MANRYTLNINFLWVWFIPLLLYIIRIKSRELKKINSTLGRHRMSNKKQHSPSKRILSFFATNGCQKPPKVLILRYEEYKRNNRQQHKRVEKNQ